MCSPFGPTISLWELCNADRKRYKYAQGCYMSEESYARAQQCLAKAQRPEKAADNRAAQLTADGGTSDVNKVVCRRSHSSKLSLRKEAIPGARIFIN